jgi:hypothetical protein
MFIQSNRFTKFYRTHKTQWVAFLTIGQLIAIAIALLTLLSILGWSLAISSAIAWLNRLVENSIEPQRLLMPAKDVSPPTVSDTEADEILTEWHDRLTKVLDRKSIRQLKKIAQERHITRYCNLTKSELIAALN